MDVESALSRPSCHPLPCKTTRRCALGSSPRNQPQFLTASPAAAEEMMAATAAPLRLHPRKRTPRLPLLTFRAAAPNLLCKWHHATVDERRPTTTSPTRTQRRTHEVTRRKIRRRMRALPGRALATRHTRTAAGIRPVSAPAPLFHQHPCIFSINYFVLKLLCLL